MNSKESEVSFQSDWIKIDPSRINFQSEWISVPIEIPEILQWSVIFWNILEFIPSQLELFRMIPKSVSEPMRINPKKIFNLVS